MLNDDSQLTIHIVMLFIIIKLISLSFERVNCCLSHIFDKHIHGIADGQ